MRSAVWGLAALAAGVAVAWWLLGRPSQPLDSSGNQPIAVASPAVTIDVPSSPARESTAVDPSLADFVGSRTCRRCHDEIVDRYFTHPMARSFAHVDRAAVIENYDDPNEAAPPGNRRYRVERSGDEIRHHEVMLDRDGEVIYDQSVPIEYALGSGKRGRAYILDRDGLMFKSSISWYAQEGRWGLSPDYPPDRHKRFERRVTGGCLNCHAGLPNFVRGETDRFGEPPFLEEPIGCERCHGPGRKHIALHESADLDDDPIINPARLEPDRREAVCAQCHLHGETRTLRTGRMPYDFRPGERLEDNWLVFVKTHGGGLTRSGRAASQVEHMVTSTCYVKSEGRMGCTSCHDPHSVPAESAKVDFYRDRCLKCHADRGCALPEPERRAAPYRDNCMTCHMPSSPSDNVLHRSVADHRIPRRPLPDSDDEDGDGDETHVFQFAATPIPKAELDRARAFALLETALGPPSQTDLAEEAQALLLPLVDVFPDDPEVLVGLGNTCQLLGEPREAAEWWRKALARSPRHEATIQTLASEYHDRFELDEAETFLLRFLALNDWHGSYHGRLAATLMQRGDLSGAIASAERALELNPTLWPLHELLVSAYTRQGDRTAAQRHRALLQRMKPAGAARPRR